jgi:hypothetical protein
MSLRNTLTERPNSRPNGQPVSVVSGPRLFEGERSLIWTGLLGLFLSLAALGFMAFKGRLVGLEGDMDKVFRFDLAVGLVLVAVAAILPLAPFSPAGRRLWRYTMIVTVLYSYLHEGVQNLRGINPRFTIHGTSPVDQMMNQTFGVASTVLIILFVSLLWQFFRRSEAAARPLHLASRYALLSTMLAIGGGILMIIAGVAWLAAQSHGTTAAWAPGYAMWLHFIGFAGMKAMIVTGWLAERPGIARLAGRRLVHLAGLAWLVAGALVTLQTYLYPTFLSITPVSIALLGSLGLWVYVILRLALGTDRAAKATAA